MEAHCVGERPLCFSDQDRDATCELWPPTRSWLSRGTRERATALAISGGGETREVAARSRCAALVVAELCTMKGHRTDGRPLSFCAILWYDVLAVPSNAQPAFAWHARKPHCAGCLSGGGEKRKLAARVRCRAGYVRSMRCERALYRREASLLRCKTVVRRARCDLQRAAGIRVARAQAPLRWLNLGRWRNTRAFRARAPNHACCGRLLGYRRALHRQKASLFRVRPWCDVRALTSNTQPAFAWHARKRHCAGCLSGGSEARELTARARRATLAAITPCDQKSTAPTGGRSLSVQDRGATCEQ